MQSTPLKDDTQAGLQAVLNDLGAIVPQQEPPKAMLEPPDLHVDLADRVSGAASEVPPLDPALRPAPLNDNRTRGTRARRSFARFVLAVCVGVAATVGWQSYGEAAREMLATWAPQIVAALPAPALSDKVAEQPKPAPAGTVEQQAPPARLVAVAAATPAMESTAAPQAAPVQAAAPAADLAPMLEDMAREIASLRQTIEQLKTGQQQMSRELAKAVEQEPRRRSAATPPLTPTPAPRPAAAASRNPVPQQAYTPPPRDQAYVPPREQVYTPPPRDQVYTPPPPQVYVPPPPSTYAAPRPPRPLP